MVLRGDDRGALAIMVALFAVTMFVLAALVVEVGSQRETQWSAQTAADTAALAAAAELYSNTGTLRMGRAARAATTYAQKNFPADQPSDRYWRGCRVDPEPGWVRSARTQCVAFLQDPVTLRYTQVQVVTPGQATVGLFGLVEGKTRALARAAVTEPIDHTPVIFGGSEICANTVQWSGSPVINGYIHSNGDLRAGGGTVNGLGTYRTDFSSSIMIWNPNANNPVQDPDPRPFPVNTGDYTTDPNFVEALPAGQLIDRPWLELNGYITAGVLDEGIYYTSGDIDVDLGGLSSGGSGTTFIADGTITFTGAGTLRPYIDDLLVYTTVDDGCDGQGVTFSAADVTLEGIIYAPSAPIDVTGSTITLNGGSVAGYTIHAVGSTMDLTEFTPTLAVGERKVHLVR